MGRRLALLIGNTTYEDPNNFHPLTWPQADANQFADFLLRYCGFEIQGTLINQKKEVVEPAIESLYQNAREGDLTLLYFSGHGFRNAIPGRRRFYLAMPGTTVLHIGSTSIPESNIKNYMETSECTHHIVVLDCCYSAAFITKGVGDQSDTAKPVELFEDLTGMMSAVLASSGSQTLSFGGSGETSYFTRYLMEGVKTGKADLDKDGEVSIHDFYYYAEKRLKEQFPMQKPAIHITTGENFPPIAWVNAPFKPSPTTPTTPVRIKEPPPVQVKKPIQATGKPPTPTTGNSDFGWYLFFIIAAIILIAFWKPISGSFARGSISSPDGFVRNYYSYLDQEKYQQSWDMLTPHFVSKFGADYNIDSYTNFWNTVDTVEVREAKVVQSGDTQSIVQARLYYKMKSGKVQDDQNFCIGLAREAKEAQWKIDGSWYAQDCTVTE